MPKYQRNSPLQYAQEESWHGSHWSWYAINSYQGDPYSVWAFDLLDKNDHLDVPLRLPHGGVLRELMITWFQEAQSPGKQLSAVFGTVDIYGKFKAVTNQKEITGFGSLITDTVELRHIIANDTYYLSLRFEGPSEKCYCMLGSVIVIYEGEDTIGKTPGW